MLNFVMEIERISFFEALKLLAERNGIPMPKREYSDPDSKLRGALLEMHEIAASVFKPILKAPAGAEARNYLAEPRRHTGADRRVRTRASPILPATTGPPASNHVFAAEQLEALGTGAKRQEGSGYFDRFRGRLMFPIHNESGKVIGFGGRALHIG